MSPTVYEAGWPAIRSAAEAAAAEPGIIRLEFIAPSAAPPGERLLDAVELATSRKPDAICIWVHDAKADAAAVKKALSSSALVLTIGAPTDESGVYAHIDCGSTSAAELLGQGLGDLPDEIRTYGLVHEAKRDRDSAACYDHFQINARNRGSVTLVDERDTTGADPRAAINAITEKFRFVGLIVTLSPQVWLEAPPRMTLRSDATRFATIGTAPGLWPEVQSGKALMLAGPLDGEIGQAAIQALLSGLTHSRPGGFTRSIPAELVTKKNLLDFARRYAAAARAELTTLWPDAPASP